MEVECLVPKKDMRSEKKIFVNVDILGLSIIKMIMGHMNAYCVNAVDITRILIKNEPASEIIEFMAVEL
jgi:hypothetical protein